MTAGAIWGAVSVSLDQWTRFNESPTVVTLEKDFRSWVFPLPGVTECDVVSTVYAPGELVKWTVDDNLE